MDETYQDYVNRVARLTLASTYHAQAAHLQPSPKFTLAADGQVQPVAFPGYSVTTPTADIDPENAPFYQALQTLQGQLAATWLVAVPPASFHVTLADLLWDDHYRSAVLATAQFDAQLQACIAESFQQFQKTPPAATGQPSRWRLMGLLLRPRAIAVCLAPQDAIAYENALALRRAIYQNPGLISLGIEQQYDFTAHVTLGYLLKTPDTEERDLLLQTLQQLNDKWLTDEPPALTISRVELRKFDDMTKFYRTEEFPTIAL